LTFRVLAATNKTSSRKFRAALPQDLFYRLNVIPFFVPPLRDRKRTFPSGEHFLNEFSELMERSAPS